jgi:integrase
VPRFFVINVVILASIRRRFGFTLLSLSLFISNDDDAAAGGFVALTTGPLAGRPSLFSYEEEEEGGAARGLNPHPHMMRHTFPLMRRLRRRTDPLTGSRAFSGRLTFLTPPMNLLWMSGL